MIYIISLPRISIIHRPGPPLLLLPLPLPEWVVAVRLFIAVAAAAAAIAATMLLADAFLPAALALSSSMTSMTNRYVLRIVFILIYIVSCPSGRDGINSLP